MPENRDFVFKTNFFIFVAVNLKPYKMKKLIISIFAAILIAGTSCKKDEETTPNPPPPPPTHEELLTGEWELTSWLINNEEWMEPEEYYLFEFNDNKTFEFNFVYWYDDIEKYNGDWNFIENNTILKVTYTSESYYDGTDWSIEYTNYDQDWEIIELTENKLKVNYQTSEFGFENHVLTMIKAK